MSFREKFKASHLAELKKQTQQAEQFVNSGKEKPDITFTNSLKDGSHLFRLLPKHEDSVSFMYQFVQSWVPGYSLKRDDKGNPIKDSNGDVMKKFTRVPVYNARVHGGSKIDIIEEYLRFWEEVKKPSMIKSNKEQSVQEIMEVLNHFKSALKPEVLWVMYACKAGDSGLGDILTLGVTHAQQKQIRSIMAEQDDSDSPIVLDPFTDPDSGRALKIIKDLDQKNAQDKYKLSIDTKVGKDQKIRLFPLSDEFLETFMQYESLEKRFRGIYNEKSFERALEGLQIYDKEHGIGIFEIPEFLEAVEEELNRWEGTADEEEERDDETSDTPSSTKSDSTKEPEKKMEKWGKEEDDEEDEEEDEEDEPGEQSVSLSQLLDTMDRKELKSYIKEKGLSIKVFKSTTEADIRDMIKKEVMSNLSKMSSKPKEEETEAEKTKAPKKEQEPEVEESPKQDEWKSRLNALSSKIKKD